MQLCKLKTRLNLKIFNFYLAKENNQKILTKFLWNFFYLVCPNLNKNKNNSSVVFYIFFSKTNLKILP